MGNPISILKDLCELANKANELVAKIKKHFPSQIQKKLLQAAAQSGEFHILQADQLAYPIIRAGGTNMGDENDPASLAELLRCVQVTMLKWLHRACWWCSISSYIRWFCQSSRYN